MRYTEYGLQISLDELERLLQRAKTKLNIVIWKTAFTFRAAKSRQ